MAVLGAEPLALQPLSGGCVAQVYRLDMPDDQRLVAKLGDNLQIEGAMLEYLAPHLPVPKVRHSAPDLLLMDYLPGQTSYSAAAQVHAAELLAGLHGVSAAQAGFGYHTLIGGLHQPNSQGDSWLDFFAEHRLAYMAQQAFEHSRMPAQTRRRIEKLAAKLGQWLAEPAQMSLLHGDVWSGNVLAQGDRITGFLDPAIYFGHAEVELAFITMFSTFGQDFFAAYARLRPIADGFMAERRHLYNLYPNLVHLRLFGGSYLQAVESTLQRFGC